jgi:hypothetical protein
LATNKEERRHDRIVKDEPPPSHVSPHGFSKKIDCHLAAVSLYVAFYNLCRTHEALLMTPAMALGIADRVWSVAELIEAALKAVPTKPTPTPTQRRRQFRVIQGDLFDE